MKARWCRPKKRGAALGDTQQQWRWCDLILLWCFLDFSCVNSTVQAMSATPHWMERSTCTYWF
ncbi:hypothetical protein BT93_F0136 [Corymbia citriodora subsp. variegata]|nr:hypothetical protein BT93_F0136 [Corymbia citriodora subsp. variegata]